LLVSHDRAFLNNVVTKTFSLSAQPKAAEKPLPPVAERPAPTPAAAPAPAKPKLSYKEQREFSALLPKISDLETEEKALEARMAEPAFYQAGKKEIAETLERVERIKAELLAAYARWTELDERA
jgi:ATP-binding cassette subfamily F protein uup